MSTTTTETAISPDVIAAENNTVRNLFGADNPNPDLGRPDTVTPPPAETENEPAERTLSPREQIAERAKAARRAAEAGTEDMTTNESGEYVPPFMKRQQDAAADADAQARAEEEAARKAAEAPKTYTLKVRGNDVPVASRDELVKLAEVDADESGDFTDAQLIKLAQKQMAANAILDEAKAAKKSARVSERADEGNTSPDPSDETDPEEDEPREPQHQRNRHREVIEKIQFGDPDEAAEVLAGYLRDSVKGAISEMEVGHRVSQVEAMIERATIEFEAANADIVQDEDFADALYNKHLVAEFKKDLINGGIPAERVEATLGNHISKAMQAYIAVASDGRVKLRTPAEMLSAAEQSWRTKYGRPSQNREPARTSVPQVANSDRLDRKRTLASQPNRASVPASTAAPKNGQTPEARASVVQKMRAQRGQA